MKDRLIELIDKAKEEYANDVTDHTETEYIVETLLNDGWIRPPCKVGDKVYTIVRNDVEESVVVSDEYSRASGWSYMSSNGKYPTLFKEKSIGKTVFLTREEAERALQEVKGK